MPIRVKLLLALFTFTFLISNAVFAFSSGIPIELPSGINIATGDLVSFTEGSYKITNQLQDDYVFGVASSTPPIALDDSFNNSSVYLVTSGEVLVKGSLAEGPIKKGDFVTTSNDIGKAQKATSSGIIIGSALEDFSAGDTDGMFAVSLNIRSVIFGNNRDNLLEVLRKSSQFATLTPVGSLRYILAFLIALGSFILGFLIFGKIYYKGIESLGRNPLAKTAIQFGIILNFILTIATMVLGLFLAYLILIL